MNFISEVCGCLLFRCRLPTVFDIFQVMFSEFMTNAALNLHTLFVELSIDYFMV